MADPYRRYVAPNGIMNDRNYGAAPFHEAFDNYEFTLAVGESLAPTYDLDSIPAVMAIGTSGYDGFLIQNNPRFQEHDSLDDTLLPHNHDPLEREAQAERDANHRADIEESNARAASSERRARYARENGIEEAWDYPWEDAAGIAEGEAINLARWGSHVDLYENSSLAEPKFVPAGPPTRGCRYDTMRGVEGVRLPTLAELEEEAAEVAAEHARRYQLEIRADEAYKKLRDKQGEHKAVYKALLDLIDQWKVDDADTHAKWIKHFANAHMCSTSSVRVWSIVSWFQRKVPLSIRQAVDNLTFHYLQEAWNAVILQKFEAELDLDVTHYNGPSSEIVGTTQTDDDYWTVTAAAQDLGGPVWDSKTWLYGCYNFEPKSHFKNGFLDFFPKGNGNAYARQLRAHLEVRRVWLEHMGDMTALDQEHHVHLLLQWGPKAGAIRGDELSPAEREAFAAFARAIADFKRALLQLMGAIQDAEKKKQERVHGRGEDGDHDGAQPQKRARTGDNAAHP
jgi:hypothetical protein